MGCESELVPSVDLSDEERKGKNQVDLQVTLHHIKLMQFSIPDIMVKPTTNIIFQPNKTKETFRHLKRIELCETQF